jgi:hypothetical protein
MTFSIIIDSIRWMSGLSEKFARSEIELLRDQFPDDTSIFLVREL